MGGSWSQIWGGPRSRSRWGVPVSDPGEVPGPGSGGVQGPGPGRGVPGPGPGRGILFSDPGGSQVQVKVGGPSLRLWGIPSLSKGKTFLKQIWFDTCSDWEKIFCGGRGPPPVKGRIFDTRFGLIHVQTGKKKICQGTSPQ